MYVSKHHQLHDRDALSALIEALHEPIHGTVEGLQSARSDPCRAMAELVLSTITDDGQVS